MSYCLFRLLEYELILQHHQNDIPATYISSPGFEHYVDLARSFPARPSRYASLVLPDDWFLRGKNQSRVPVVGVDLAELISSSWKNANEEIHTYVYSVASIVKKRHDQIRLFCKVIDKNDSEQLTGSTSPPSIVCQVNDVANGSVQNADERQTQDCQSSIGVASPGLLRNVRNNSGSAQKALMSPFQSHQGQARRASLPQMDLSQPRALPFHPIHASRVSPTHLVGYQNVALRSTASCQARRASCSDLDSNRLAVRAELNRLSMEVAASLYVDPAEQPAQDKPMVLCQPAQFLQEESPSAQEAGINWAQEIVAMRAWGRQLMNEINEMAEPPKFIEEKVGLVDMTDDAILAYYHSLE